MNINCNMWISHLRDLPHTEKFYTSIGKSKFKGLLNVLPDDICNAAERIFPSWLERNSVIFPIFHCLRGKLSLISTTSPTLANALDCTLCDLILLCVLSRRLNKYSLRHICQNVSNIFWPFFHSFNSLSTLLSYGLYSGSSLSFCNSGMPVWGFTLIKCAGVMEIDEFKSSPT